MRQILATYLTPPNRRVANMPCPTPGDDGACVAGGCPAGGRRLSLPPAPRFHRSADARPLVDPPTIVCYALPAMPASRLPQPLGTSFSVAFHCRPKVSAVRGRAGPAASTLHCSPANRPAAIPYRTRGCRGSQQRRFKPGWNSTSPWPPPEGRSHGLRTGICTAPTAGRGRCQ